INWQNNFSKLGLPQLHAYYVLFSSILILVIVFWKILVCLAVVREQNLLTTTSYLVISLAIADLLVAILVMPWVIYLEAKHGEFYSLLTAFLCDTHIE
ncbi:hypothetical protein E2320_005338, partial [Naja naja]